MAADTPQINVGSAEGGLYIGLLGRATQRVCPTIDRVVGEYLASKHDSPCVQLDLEGCQWIDSTFAGWLAGLHKRLRRMDGARMRLVNCAERARASLDKMQLCSLFDCTAALQPPETRAIPCDTSDRPDRAALELMLRAHEELAGINPANAAVFGPIVAALRQQLHTVAAH